MTLRQETVNRKIYKKWRKGTTNKGKKRDEGSSINQFTETLHNID
jgi:hypothetical protein